MVLDAHATPEEVAALVAVVQGMAAAAAAAGAPTAGPASRGRTWCVDPARRVRRPPPPGPGGWRASALPR